ncbi:MAG: HD-GYP domain-containing protein [Gammaproteobacteria bacterium]
MNRKQRLKKVSVEQLKLGVYVAELCGSWMDHPFWNSRFKLDDPADLKTLQNSAVSEVWIDLNRGADVDTDVAEEPAAESLDEQRARQEFELTQTFMAPVQDEDTARTEFAAEVERAAKICDKARTAVTAMFDEARMGRAADAAAMDSLVEEISHSVMRNPGALISLARLKTKDDYTYMHSVAVCGLMVALARQLGFDEPATREAGLAGLVHDIGKATSDLDILNKPGKLTDEEFRHMQQHPVAGHAMLVEGNTVGEIPLDVCLHHHEKMDGSGYPERLRGEEISLYAKMGAVCDVYDAITSDRPYKAGWDPATAIRKMHDWSEGHFDRHVFQAFVKTVGIYPIGSLVRLQSERLGVVCESSTETLLKPVVKAFFCTRRGTRTPVEMLDLASPEAGDDIKGWENPEDWSFPDLNELWSGAA